MKTKLSFVLSLLVGLALVAPTAFTQDFFSAGDAFDPSAPLSFSPKDFGAGLSGASKTLDVKASVAPSPDAVDDFWTKQDTKLVGFLSVQTVVADGWHIYTPTQGSGGMPTKFDDLKADAPQDANVTIGEVRLATECTIAKDALGAELQELFGSVEWIAPIYAASDVDLAQVKISGTVNGLACSEGEGGACVPQTENFSAEFNADVNVDSILQAAQKLSADSSKTDAQTADASADAETRADPQTNADAQVTDQDPSMTQASRHGFFVLLLTAFLGGLILNITPCVLPVVGLKILSFFEQAGRSRANAFMLNVWYTLGVLIVFGVLAFASMGLSFLFTRAIFQILMSAIVFCMALSLMGVWELQTPAFLGGEKSTELSSKEGPFGAVCKGVITTLLAIPCGAPLLSPALDWASETTRQGQMGLVVVVYLVIGLGMAFPFLAAGAFPELLKFFPKPGEWMETFRKTMGYFLLIAVLWILYSAPLEYLLPSIALLFALWFACWNIGRNQWEFENPKKKVVGWIVSLAILAIVAIFSFDFPGNPNHTTLQAASSAKLTRWAIRAEREGALTQEHWALFDRDTLDRELGKGRVVAVDFTADWCMNCKFLEKTILHTEEIEAKFDEINALTLTADWTNQDAQTPEILAINELLDANGARQVPTLMIFTPQNPDKPIVLRGLYTKSALLEALESIDSK